MTKVPPINWNDRFSDKTYLYGTEPNDFLKEKHHHIPAKGRVLCIGEGEGRNAVYLAQQGYEVTALDASIVGLEKTKQLAQQKNVNVKTQHIDLAHYEFTPNHWDAVVSIFCHLPPQLRQKVHQAIPLTLKSNGVMLLEAYRPPQLELGTGGPKDPALFYSYEMIANDLQALTPLFLASVMRHIKEGVGHDGLSATVQFVGQK